MNWLLLIVSSAISAAIIIFAMWPKMIANVKIRAICLSLSLAVLIFPASLNYYLVQDDDQYRQPVEAIDYSELGELKWKAPFAMSPRANGNNMSMATVTARLEAKLKQNPNDIGGWILLGRSYVALGQPARATTIFEERLEENPENIDLLLSYGETLVEINRGLVDQKSASLFQQALDLEPNNPRAGYDLSLYEIQKGDMQQAASRLNNLLETAPPGATWVTQVRERLASINQNPSTSNAMKQPTAEQVQEITSLSAEDQNAFIRNMVDSLAVKLEENPNDLDGWLNLGRSYGVLGEWQKSADAYQNAIKLIPDDKNIQMLLEQAKSNISFQ